MIYKSNSLPIAHPSITTLAHTVTHPHRCFLSILAC